MAAYAASWPLSHLHCKVIARGHDPVVFPDGTGMCRRCYRPLTQ